MKIYIYLYNPKSLFINVCSQIAPLSTSHRAIIAQARAKLPLIWGFW